MIVYYDIEVEKPNKLRLNLVELDGFNSECDGRSTPRTSCFSSTIVSPPQFCARTKNLRLWRLAYT